MKLKKEKFKMTINFKNNTIEITKTESKAASKFGSEAYRQLQEARRDYPTYTVVIKTTSKKSNEFKGFTYEYMEDYISKHDDDAHSIMKGTTSVVVNLTKQRKLLQLQKHIKK